MTNDSVRAKLNEFASEIKAETEKRQGVVRLIDTKDDCQFITPKELMRILTKQGDLNNCDAAIVIGIKNKNDEFRITVEGYAGVGDRDIIVACELLKLQCIDNL